MYGLWMGEMLNVIFTTIKRDAVCNHHLVLMASSKQLPHDVLVLIMRRVGDGYGAPRQTCRAWYRAWRAARVGQRRVMRQQVGDCVELWRRTNVVEWIRWLALDDVADAAPLAALTALEALDLTIALATRGTVPWTALTNLSMLWLHSGLVANGNLDANLDTAVPWSQLTSLELSCSAVATAFDERCLEAATRLRRLFYFDAGGNGRRTVSVVSRFATAPLEYLRIECPHRLSIPWEHGLVDVALLPLARSLRHLHLRWLCRPASDRTDYLPWLARMTALEHLTFEGPAIQQGRSWYQERAPSSLTSLHSRHWHLLNDDAPLPRLRELVYLNSTRDQTNWVHMAEVDTRGLRGALQSGLRIIRLPHRIVVVRSGPRFSYHTATVPKRRRPMQKHDVETDVHFEGFEWHAADGGRRLRTTYNLHAHVPNGDMPFMHDYCLHVPAWAEPAATDSSWKFTPMHSYPCDGQQCCRGRNLPFETMLWSGLEVVDLYDAIYNALK